MHPQGTISNLDSVNPLIGTGKQGSCLIGPCLPFGIVRLGPDTVYPQRNSGYRPNQPVIGFSHTHLSGTGGSPRHGNIRLMPFIGQPRRFPVAPFVSFPATNRQWSVPVDGHAEPGLYRCRFSFGVEVELTCTRRAGIHRYRFTGAGPRHVIVDFAATLQNANAPAGNALYCEDWEMEAVSTGGNVEVLNEREMAGRSDIQGGWGHFGSYQVFSFLRSSQPFASCELFDARGATESATAEGPGLRALLTYPESVHEICFEVGISFSSAERARNAVETESVGQTVEVVHQKARAAWTPWLDRIQVKGGTPDQQALLATSLLHLFTMPTDMSADGQTTAIGTPALTDFICLWDSIRNANSLFHLIAPEFSADIMNSLLDNADKTGWLPDAHLAGQFAFQQSGCCAEILFSEAARKGVAGVDYRRALAACIRNAETPSPDPYYFGRYLDDYEKLGYLSTNVERSCVSRHIEYTYQDWCIARLAEHLGDRETAARFDAKARRLWNLWREDKGVFWPRRQDGSWAEHRGAEFTRPDSYNDPYTYEGSLLHWSFNGLHDIEGLIQRRGGNSAFVAYLDTFFEGHPFIEKETRMHIPHLYAFAGRSARAAEQVSWSLANRYANSPDGIPDDEDMGCHSGYYICNAIGLYPIYGRTLYSIVPPLFEESVVQYGRTGKSLTIIRKGDGHFPISIRLNGTEHPGTLLEHRQIADGGVLEIFT